MFAFALIVSRALSVANAVINSNGTTTANGLTLFVIFRSAMSACYFVIGDDDDLVSIYILRFYSLEWPPGTSQCVFEAGLENCICPCRRFAFPINLDSQESLGMTPGLTEASTNSRFNQEVYGFIEFEAIHNGQQVPISLYVRISNEYSTGISWFGIEMYSHDPHTIIDRASNSTKVLQLNDGFKTFAHPNQVIRKRNKWGLAVAAIMYKPPMDRVTVKLRVWDLRLTTSTTSTKAPFNTGGTRATNPTTTASTKPLTTTTTEPTTTATTKLTTTITTKLTTTITNKPTTTTTKPTTTTTTEPTTTTTTEPTTTTTTKPTTTTTTKPTTTTATTPTATTSTKLIATTTTKLTSTTTKTTGSPTTNETTSVPVVAASTTKPTTASTTSKTKPIIPEVSTGSSSNLDCGAYCSVDYDSIVSQDS